MSVYTYIYIGTRTYVYIHTQTLTHAYIIYIYIYVDITTYTYIYLYMYIHILGIVVAARVGTSDLGTRTLLSEALTAIASSRVGLDFLDEVIKELALLYCRGLNYHQNSGAQYSSYISSSFSTIDLKYTSKSYW